MEEEGGSGKGDWFGGRRVRTLGQQEDEGGKE